MCNKNTNLPHKRYNDYCKLERDVIDSFDKQIFDAISCISPSNEKLTTFDFADFTVEENPPRTCFIDYDNPSFVFDNYPISDLQKLQMENAMAELKQFLDKHPNLIRLPESICPKCGVHSGLSELTCPECGTVNEKENL